MKVLGLDNKEYSWYLVGYSPLQSDERPRSELHVRVRALLKDIFSSQTIVEEVPLPGSGKTALYADFYLPQLKLMVECHGRQHYEFVSHFHGDYGGFINSKKRDNNKIEWCQKNKISLAILSYKGTEDEWRSQINEVCFGK